MVSVVFECLSLLEVPAACELWRLSWASEMLLTNAGRGLDEEGITGIPNDGCGLLNRAQFWFGGGDGLCGGGLQSRYRLIRNRLEVVGDSKGLHSCSPLRERSRNQLLEWGGV